MEIEGLEQILKRASAKNTCWPGCADAWSEENPAWGHCAMYTLFVNEYIGGKILSANAHLPDGKVIPHYFNSIPFSIAKNHDFDFSASQFPSGTSFKGRDNVSREYVLSLPDKEAERYRVFRQRVNDILNEQRFFQ